MEIQEKIDQYLLDQLNSTDKAQFEDLISKDTRLKNEVALQKSISNTINQSGSMALKSKLNNMPISMASTGRELAIKWVGATVVTAVLTGLIVFYLIPSEKEYQSKVTQNTNTTQELVTINTQETNTPNIVATENNNSIEKGSNTNNSVVVSKNSSEKKTPQKKSTSVELDAYKENIDFSEIAEADGDLSKAHQAVNAPTSNLTSENNKLSSLSVTIDSSNPSEKSYLFSGSKLTLFGDFAQYPYELLELNHKGEKALFLSYQSEFYELIWGKNTKSPLNKVTNKQTIEKLKLINH